MGYVKKLIDIRAWDNMTLRLGHTPTCDFCGDSHPLYVYAANRMSNGDFRDCWRWCACWSCYFHVENDEWREVENNMVKALRRILPNESIIILQRMVHLSLNDFYLYSKKGAG